VPALRPVVFCNFQYLFSARLRRSEVANPPILVVSVFRVLQAFQESRFSFFYIRQQDFPITRSLVIASIDGKKRSTDQDDAGKNRGDLVAAGAIRDLMSNRLCKACKRRLAFAIT